MVSDIKAFIRKIEFREQNLIDFDIRHFSTVNIMVSTKLQFVISPFIKIDTQQLSNCISK
ncbi:unnamed protein product [Acanthoscelides obtectus]|uniref:Uncharacterized protein n=1 Tax=Acanthoscelides obtectus TaxID=200917 RepID=A0A9P0QA83_ACAOB|nr:unnamed protein product [Acanthoscelides obtectus]CAK1684183.1 hypothetical protein AOBTE_LOCUS34690 [Acanthoscelides obtectus]